MSEISKLIKKSKKIVVKIGSQTFSDKAGNVNIDAMRSIVHTICDWTESGKRVILVSSGAGLCGISAINKWERKGDIHYKQALCAIGQVELMMTYKKLFAERGVHVAQMLLTSDDFCHQIRDLHMRNTLFTLIDEGVIPIINENDSVSVEEIKIGDNDKLAAQTAVLWAADLLIILSDIDGIYDKNPKEEPESNLIEIVNDIEELKEKIELGKANEFGTGGIVTKIDAAENIGRLGIPLVLANGTKKDILKILERGEGRGTVFFP